MAITAVCVQAIPPITPTNKICHRKARSQSGILLMKWKQKDWEKEKVMLKFRISLKDKQTVRAIRKISLNTDGNRRWAAKWTKALKWWIHLLTTNASKKKERKTENANIVQMINLNKKKRHVPMRSRTLPKFGTLSAKNMDKKTMKERMNTRRQLKSECQSGRCKGHESERDKNVWNEKIK